MREFYEAVLNAFNRENRLLLNFLSFLSTAFLFPRTFDSESTKWSISNNECFGVIVILNLALPLGTVG